MKIVTISVIALCGFVASCANQGNSVSARQAAYLSYDRPAKLPSNPSNVRVKVSISKGLAYVMEGGEPLLVMPVGVGKAQTPTPKGTFRIYSKEQFRRANTHGLAYKDGQIRRAYLRDRKAGESFKGTPMPYWCEFKSAYGFHTGWIRPVPHTNGCLRMHQNIAPKFFRIVQSGTPVNIADRQPEDETLGKNFAWPPSADGLSDHENSYYLTDKYFSDHKTPSFQ